MPDPKTTNNNLDDWENSPLVYGDRERFDDARTAELISEFNDCLPGREHVYRKLVCIHCGRPFQP